MKSPCLGNIFIEEVEGLLGGIRISLAEFGDQGIEKGDRSGIGIDKRDDSDGMKNVMFASGTIGEIGLLVIRNNALRPFEQPIVQVLPLLWDILEMRLKIPGNSGSGGYRQQRPFLHGHEERQPRGKSFPAYIRSSLPDNLKPWNQ